MNEINTQGGLKLSGVDVRPADRQSDTPLTLTPATPGESEKGAFASSGTQAAEQGKNVEPSNPVVEAEDKLNDIIGKRLGDRRLRIEIDEETNRFVYKSVDSETGEVISQFPPEEILDLIEAIREFAGLTVDQKA